MSKQKRPTARRDMLRRAVRERQEGCYLCGQAIDYSLPHLHPASFVIDHVVPLARGGADALSNVRATHRACNLTKGDRLVDQLKRKPRPPEQVGASDIW